MSSTQATKEALWWKKFFSGIGYLQASDLTQPIQLYSDSQGSIALAKNPESHGRSKHIDIQHHFVRQQVASKNEIFQYISTEDMPADMLTKAMPKERHANLMLMIGLR